MIEDALVNYGALGVIVLYFIYDKVGFQKGITKVIENNTIALTKVYGVISKCTKH